jgi:cation transport ATPase
MGVRNFFRRFIIFLFYMIFIMMLFATLHSDMKMVEEFTAHGVVRGAVVLLAIWAFIYWLLDMSLKNPFKSGSGSVNLKIIYGAIGLIIVGIFAYATHDNGKAILEGFPIYWFMAAQVYGIYFLFTGYWR